MTEPAVETQTEYALRCGNGMIHAGTTSFSLAWIVDEGARHDRYCTRSDERHTVVSRTVTRTPWTPVEATP